MQNSLYEIFKPPSQAYLDQLAHAKEVRKKMWRKSFVKTKPNIVKNIAFLLVLKSISKSRQAYNKCFTDMEFDKNTFDASFDKTQNDSFQFVLELKKEMHKDLKYIKLRINEYVKSLEKEVDELESEKADFSNIYDLLLEEFKECECLAQKLSKQTESVNNEVDNKLLKSFVKLEKHSISLELSLQHCKEQMKNNPVCKENASNVFRKEREQYHEIQDLKTQLQDKNIAITSKTVRNTNVLKPGMYQIDTRTTQTRAPQLPQTSRNTNPYMSTSIRVIHRTSVSRPQLKSTQVKDKVMQNNSRVTFKKTEVEDHRRISSIYKKTKSVIACNDSLNSKTLNVNAVCADCGKCVFNSNHDACVSKYLNDVNARTKKPKVVPISARKPKDKANKSVATPHKKTVAPDTTIQKSKSYFRELYENTNREWKWWIEKQSPSGYKWTPKPPKTKKIWMPKIQKENVSTSISPTIDIVSRITNIVQLILFIVDSGCTKHMTGNLKLLCNFVEKFLGTVRFGNDQFAPILGYGDLIQGNVMIKRVYYVEGLNHNLFSVGQFCDADLEVAFWKSTCYVRDLQGNDLLTGNRGSDLYTISLQETTLATPLCLMAKASPTQL
ncbi:hypothetical protein Tco_0415005 [Tanacetum coccineum]